MNAQPVDDVVDRLHHSDELAALEGVRSMLRLVGEDPDRPGLADTPARVLKAFRELAGGTEQTVAAILARTFDDVGDVDEVVAVGPIAFVSMCEHHLLPFTGTAWVAYKPEDDRTVVGLSKLARLVEHVARRPQVQERMTSQITHALTEHLSPNAACVVRAHHSCMGLRGVRASTAQMVTSSLRGLFREDARARAEFLALTGAAGG